MIIILLAVAMLTGLSLILYPTVSDLWNSYHQTKAVLSYAEVVSGMKEEEKAAWKAAAIAYNEALAEKGSHWDMTQEEWEEYERQLDVTGTGIMAYVEIPQINVSLPIYHGTEESVLQQAAGHIEGSSLPIGGENSHAAISGHRGLPSARLFTDIDQLEEGSVFYIHVLEETLTYEVDQILTVDPDDLEALEIQEGQDLCTLVTCTPYGINSQRLLVRGHRIETPRQTQEKAAQQTFKADGALFKRIAGIGGLLALVILPIVLKRVRRRSRLKHQKTTRR